MTLKEIRKLARERMGGSCKVCPVCNGVVCAGEVPGMGGLGTGGSFKDNVVALDEARLNMRLMHEVGTPGQPPELGVTVCGQSLSMPVLAAPIGGVAFNMGGAMAEADYIRAKLEGCVQAGVLGSTGDGVPPEIIDSGLAAIAAVDGRGIPFVKPWAEAELDEKLGRALDSGAPVVGMDIDAAGLVTLAKMGRPVTPKGPRELAPVVERVRAAGKAFVLKGIMTPEEAVMAADLGVSAIVVSNHGGRVLDACPGTARVLPAIALAVADTDLEVLVDGGVRSGVDVLKMLALGARAVLIGRPFSIATIGGGAEGVASWLEQLRGELTQAMVMTGTARADAVDTGILARIPAC